MFTLINNKFIGLIIHGKVSNFSTTTPTSSPLYNHHLFPKIDWEKVDAGQYAIVDPVNPGVILYLSEQNYIIMVRVAITSNKTLKVLATPGDGPNPPSSPSSQNSQNSPTKVNFLGLDSGLNLGKQSSKGRRSRSRLRNLFMSILQPFFAKSKVSTREGSQVKAISMVKLTYGNICKWFHTWHDLVLWWSRGSSITTTFKAERISFGLKLKKVLKNNGINHLIARLKIMLFTVNAFLGGRRLSDTSQLGFRIRLRNGLPSMLPSTVRAGLRFGNKHYIHIWTSCLFAYKGILGTWQEPYLATGSITNKHPVYNENSGTVYDFKQFVLIFWAAILPFTGVNAPDLTIKGTFFSTHAGPNHPQTILGAGLDAYLWCALDKLETKIGKGLSLVESEWKEMHVIRQVTGVNSNYIREWLTATGQTEIWKEFRKTAKMFALQLEIRAATIQTVYPKGSLPDSKTETLLGLNSKIPGSFQHVPEFIRQFLGYNAKGYRFTNPTLQRLHNLYEAAGKVRTIAIVDYWTNFVLKPLHDWMFKVLKALPQDATFDQEGKVREFASRGYDEVWSYDLKSATDLIPLALYRYLFSQIISNEIIDIWFKLLVDRRFLVPRSTVKTYKDHPARIKYSTGQPMGALTSWASMALVHHALVLFSALKAGVITPLNLLDFKDYMVLGDDVVIANRAVAASYARLMKDLHIPLSIAKSHISEMGMFNFANQTFVRGQNVSPISMREECNATCLPERAEMVLRMARRGWFSVTSRTWVVQLVKRTLRLDDWMHIQPLIKSRIVHPVVNWILSVMLTPGTTRFGFAGISHVNLETFLGVQLRKKQLFSSDITSMSNYIDRLRSRDLLVSLLGKWVNAVYSQFLLSRKRLENYPKWVTTVMSVELEWLLNRVFSEAKTEALSRWTTKYRYHLKTLQVTARLSNFTLDDIQICSSMTLSENIKLLAEAEKDLPLIPDFSQDTIDALNSLLPEGLSDKQLWQRQKDSFMRITNLLGMIDNLGSLNVPGLDEAWDKSQSDHQHAADDQNKNPES